MGFHTHRKEGPKSVRAAVVTVSSTRVPDTDESGRLIASLLAKAGHTVVDHRVVPDDALAISAALRDILAAGRARAVFINGGTGITARDVTIETVRPLFDKEMTAFATLFTQLSFDQVDTACLLSRATAGVVDGVFVACMPGSPKACKLAVADILLPELGHIVGHLPAPRA